jgi:hypothetical protein
MIEVLLAWTLTDNLPVRIARYMTRPVCCLDGPDRMHVQAIGMKMSDP